MSGDSAARQAIRAQAFARGDPRHIYEQPGLARRGRATLVPRRRPPRRNPVLRPPGSAHISLTARRATRRRPERLPRRRLARRTRPGPHREDERMPYQMVDSESARPRWGGGLESVIKPSGRGPLLPSRRLGLLLTAPHPRLEEQLTARSREGIEEEHSADGLECFLRTVERTELEAREAEPGLGGARELEHRLLQGGSRRRLPAGARLGHGLHEQRLG